MLPHCEPRKLFSVLTFPDAVRITIKVSFELRKMEALAFHGKAENAERARSSDDLSLASGTT
jgi:Arc/MetJ family transcription regulator